MALTRTVLCGVMLIGFGNVVAAQTAGGVLVGSVVTDSTLTPVEGAEVILPQLSKRAATTSAGRFRLDGIPAGTHDVIVRSVGFSPVALQLVFAVNDSVDRDFILRRVPRLEGITVEASAVIPTFEEHRRIGLGTFVTRTELEKMDQQRVSDIMAHARGARIHNASGGRAFLYSSRRQVTSIDPRGTKGDPSRFARENAGIGVPFGLCYAQVYMDDRLVYRGEESEQVFDINSLKPSEIEAIEYYSGPGSTPARYSRQNSNCGVIVIHTRRTLGGVKPRSP